MLTAKMEDAIFMTKLTNEQKIEIYERRLKDETLPSLALKFNVNIHNIKYLIRFLNKHGYSILRNDKNKNIILKNLKKLLLIGF